MNRLVIATRGSKLALAQARWVAERLGHLHPGLSLELEIIKTKGDKILDVALAKVGGKGLFVKEIEDALLNGEAQLAVHSLKDMPADLPSGLLIAAIPPREDPCDVFVGRGGSRFVDLPPQARIGTSSLRRQAQLLAARPDLEIISIRGNVETRLRKMQEQNLDGVVLAAAGLKRLGLGEAGGEALPPEVMLPAVGQGALAIEARQDDAQTLALLEPLDHPDTRDAVAAERAFLARLQGGCQVPIAGHAQVEGKDVVLKALVAGLDGNRVIHGRGRASRDGAGAMGRQVAEEILANGGREILAQVYGEAPA